MNARLISSALLMGLVAAAPTPMEAEQKPVPARIVNITVNDPVGEKMSYSLSQIVAKPGEKLTVRMVSMAQTPKIVMAHNWLLLKAGTNEKAFADAAANARATDFIPPALKGQILAELPLLGPGEKAEVTFTVPKVPGSYPYLCSFAGHWAAGMKGTLIVK
jgi:azurin